MGSESSSRRHFKAEEKANILLQVFRDKMGIAEVCEKNKIQPSMLYAWQKQAFDNLSASLATSPSKPKNNVVSIETKMTAKIEKLEAKLAIKDEVIAEISEDYVKLKKALGDH